MTITLDDYSKKKGRRQQKKLTLEDVSKPSESVANAIGRSKLFVKKVKDESIKQNLDLDILKNLQSSSKATLSLAVDWVGDFKSKMDSLRIETNVEARLEFLSDVIERILVRTIDKKANLVELDIRFKLPYVGDALNRSSDSKSDGYELVEGGKSLKKELVRVDGRNRL